MDFDRLHSRSAMATSTTSNRHFSESLRALTRSIDGVGDQFFRVPRRSHALTRLMVYAANSGVYSWIWIAAAVIGVLFVPGRRWYFVVFALAVVGEFITTNGLLKPLLRRGRPAEPLDSASTAGLRRPRTPSFPSGHASAAAFSATVLLVFPALGIPALIWALLISFSRIFLRLHYLTDILAGVVWGTLLGVTFRTLA